MLKREFKLDASEQIFFGRQLEFVKSKTYDVQYPEFKQRMLLPVSYEAGPGAETIKYEQFDSTGVAKIVGNYAADFPRADIKGKEFISSVKSLGASYGYNVQEIRAAMFANKPLQQRKANAARRAVMQKEQSVAYFGDADTGLGGFLTNANVTTSTVTADGTGSTTTFSTKDADQILRDLNQCANNIVSLTLGVEQPDTLLLPVEQYTLIASTPRSSVSDTTILQYFLNNNPFIKTVTLLNQLEEPDAGWASVGASFTGDIMVAYRRDPDKLTLEIPQDFEQFPVQEENMEYTVPCHQRIGGVLIYYPLSINIMQGI